MNGSSSNSSTGLQTSHGLCILIAACVLIVVLFYIAGFRAMITVGAGVGR